MFNLRPCVLRPASPKKSAALKICGSNPVLQNQKIVFTPQTQWAALRAAHRSCSETELCIKLASLYNSARTYFMENC